MMISDTDQGCRVLSWIMFGLILSILGRHLLLLLWVEQHLDTSQVGPLVSL